ncbi:MAG: hypothetical protein GY928_13215 [Colwellia sp.]|nr:hypothetical protein [Colwellia sp.]
MEFYRSKLSLFTMLYNNYKGVSFSPSLTFLHPYTFVLEKNNEVVRAATIKEFYENLNAKLGCNIDTEKSIRVGTRGYGLYYNSEAKVQVAEEVVQEDEKPEVDWDKVEAFKNKDDLEKYGLTFGIDLNKRKSLSNMVKELKEALAK